MNKLKCQDCGRDYYTATSLKRLKGNKRCEVCNGKLEEVKNERN